MGEPEARARRRRRTVKDAVPRDARRRPRAAAHPRDHRHRARCMWASDYPHPEGTFPESQQVVERIFAGVPEAEMTRDRERQRGRASTGVDGARVSEQHAEGQDRDRRRRRDAVLQARASRCRRRRWSSRARRCSPRSTTPASPSTTSTASRSTAWASTRRCSRSGSASPRCGSPRMLTGGGGGAAGSVGLASAAIASGMAECVVSVMTLQQAASRFGASFAPRGKPGAVVLGAAVARGQLHPAVGADGPGPDVRGARAAAHAPLRHDARALLPRSRSRRATNAIRRPTSLMQEPLTLDDYFDARMISDPLCLFDFCLECDGAVAVVTTSAERATRPAPPAGVRHGASAHGGHGRWGQAITWMGMPDEYFASSGHRPVAKRLYEMAGVGPADVDVALIYDHFTPDGDHAARGLRLLRHRRGRPVRRRRQHPLARRRRCRSTRTAATCRRRTSSA